MKSQELAYILLSFVLAATFISIFFFTYVSSVEEEIIKTQISNIVDEFTKSAVVMLPPDELEVVKAIITANLTMPDMSDEDKQASDTNSALLKKTIVIVSILVGSGGLIILIMWLYYRFDILEITKYSIIILALVAVTETLFVTLVTKNFILVDQNYFNTLILTNLYNYANSPDPVKTR